VYEACSQSGQALVEEWHFVSRSWWRTGYGLSIGRDDFRAGDWDGRSKDVRRLTAAPAACSALPGMSPAAVSALRYECLLLRVAECCCTVSPAACQHSACLGTADSGEPCSSAPALGTACGSGDLLGHGCLSPGVLCSCSGLGFLPVWGHIKRREQGSTSCAETLLKELSQMLQ